MKTKYPIMKFVDSIKNDSEIPSKIANGIRITVEDFSGRYDNLDEEKAINRISPNKWSIKEILGHLIDSASNNHQRFVRAQYEMNDNFICYEQNSWVKIQNYNLRTWKELLSFWKSYNLHLAHIIERMPTECIHIKGVLGSYGQVTIGYIVVDYLGHIQHHLKQIEESLK